MLSPSWRQVTHALLTRPPLSSTKITPKGSISRFSLDLHVLGTPPAFVLSQDQTLQKTWRTWMALKIIHVMEFQIVFRTNLVLFIFCIRIADTKSNIWLEIMCAWFLLHCLVFKEHCLPLHQRFVKALQAFCKTAVWVSFYIISQSVHFVKNFFEIFFVAGSVNHLSDVQWAFHICHISATTMYILH